MQTGHPLLRFPRKELAEYLRAFRGIRSREEIADELRKLIRKDEHRHLEPFASKQGIKDLESPGASHLELTLEELRLLCKAYAVSYLMLLPLAADLVNKAHVHLAESDFEEFPPDDELTATGSKYFFTRRRLSEAHDSAIVRVVLPPGARSETHAHHGDEIMFVSKGEVEVRLAGCGMYNRLSQHNLMHFYGEHTHCVHNLSSEQSEILVIRCYQLSRTGIRTNILSDMEAELRRTPITSRAAGGSEKSTTAVDRRPAAPSKHMIARATAELRRALAAEPVPHHLSLESDVVDPFGLGRFLDIVNAKPFQPKKRALDTIARQCKELALSKFDDRNKIRRLQEGLLTGVRAGDFGELAAVYEISPVLLCDYLVPIFRNSITIRPQEDLLASPFPNDAPGAQYSLPRRRLADSNVSIAHLALEPGAATPKNRHPGFELLVPIDGHLTVWIANETVELAEGRTLLAHYRSNNVHEVRNTGSTLATAWAVRFYQ